MMDDVKIVKEWPKWAWVSRHAENSQNDQLVMIGPGQNHVFPHLGPVWYCGRQWGPQEYIEYRMKLLLDMAEDLQKLIILFQEPEKPSGLPLLELLEKSGLVKTSLSE